MDEAPKDYLLYTGLGLASLRMGDVVPARRYLQKAVELNGNYFQSRLGLGYAYLQKNENPLAVKELERSMELMPGLEGSYNFV